MIFTHKVSLSCLTGFFFLTLNERELYFPDNFVNQPANISLILEGHSLAPKCIDDKSKFRIQ